MNQLCDTSGTMAAIAFRGLTPFLKTMDLARTIDFYVNLLGFVVDMQWPAGTPTDCILDNGHVHLAFGFAAAVVWPYPQIELNISSGSIAVASAMMFA
jgi:catechol 2,3-dioxygenase-like lactoylglutathione lyase family enzyme